MEISASRHLFWTVRSIFCAKATPNLTLISEPMPTKTPTSYCTSPCEARLIKPEIDENITKNSPVLTAFLMS